MHNTEAEIIYKKLNSDLDKHQRDAYIQSIQRVDIEPIIKLWRAQVILHGPVPYEMQILTRVIRQILSLQAIYLNDLTLEEIDGLARYLQKSHNFQDILLIITQLYLLKNVQIFNQSRLLFQTIVHTFQYIPNDQLRDTATQILLNIMKKTPEFIQFCSHPYFFLEYFLHLINQQEDEQKMIVWWSYIQLLYMHDKAQQRLFSKNDFRILVDVLVRQIQNFNSEKLLIRCIEIYLVLSLHPNLIDNHKLYKIDQIIIALQEISHPSTAIQQYSQQIKSLLFEKH